jgi:hypothetical protein
LDYQRTTAGARPATDSTDRRGRYLPAVAIEGIMVEYNRMDV